MMSQHINEIEEYLIENKLGSDSIEFNNMMNETKRFLGISFGKSESIKYSEKKKIVRNIIDLVKKGSEINKAVTSVGLTLNDYYINYSLTLRDAVKLERIKFKNSIQI